MPTMEDRLAAGRGLRKEVPRGGLGRWRLAEDRPGPVDLVDAAHEGRQPWLMPVRAGNAHLGNFGFYASPERDLVFDLNDVDEAHPGPWEWDLRGLVTSVWVAGVVAALTAPATIATADAGVGTPVQQAYLHQVVPFQRATVISSVSLAASAGGIGGQRGACAAQALPAVASVDTTVRQPAASTP
jgi:Uncharacterized protein conserved in bacteria (DUF2252)